MERNRPVVIDRNQPASTGRGTDYDTPSPPSSARIGRAVRLAGWNALFIIAGLALLVGIGEIYLRWSVPFMTRVEPYTFVPGVGVLFVPNAEGARDEPS